MSNTNYNKKVLEHFKNPQNMGEMKNPDAEATVRNSQCGDVMKIMLKIKKAPSFRKKGSLESENLDRRNVEVSQMGEDKIEDIKFQTMGCIAVIATSSTLTEMAKGKNLNDAKKICNTDIVEALGELPPIKVHCSNLAADALKKAIEDYEGKSE